MKFSIVTISYNQACFLEQAIRSVLEQNLADVEYIVVDAGSTDGSREIIEKYRSRISRTIFEPDRGPADGLNKGFACATGDIYGYINADDYFAPHAFRHVMNIFESGRQVDVLCGAIRIVDGEGRVRLRKLISSPFTLKRYLAGVSCVGQQATFFRCRAFERTGAFNVRNSTCWDGELLVDFALAGCCFAVTRRVLGNFRIHRESISGSGRLKEQYLKDRQRIVERLTAADISIHPLYRSALRVWHKVDALRHFWSLAVR